MNLLTGHLGYIGSEVRKRLPGYELCDLRDGDDYRDIKGNHYQTVVHLAASVSVIESMSKPELYYENNCDGLRAFFWNNFIERFVFTSTGGAMYGNLVNAKEGDAHYSNCLSPYAKSKFIGEQIIRANVPNHCILRLANVTGGNPAIRGEPTAEQHFKFDNPIIVYGGQQTRDFVSMDVVVEAIERAAKSQIVGTYNIGSGNESKVIDLAHDYATYRNVEMKIFPERKGEIEKISLDISKAQKAGLL